MVLSETVGGVISRSSNVFDVVYEHPVTVFVDVEEKLWIPEAYVCVLKFSVEIPLIEVSIENNVPSGDVKFVIKI